MNVIVILLIALLAVLAGVLMLRVRLVVNTFQDRYEVQVIPIGRMQLVIDDAIIGYRWKALFITGKGQLFPPLNVPSNEEKNSSSPEEGSSPVQKDVVKENKRPRHVLSLARRIWSGIKVNSFYLRLNLEDPILNAWVFPVFMFWRSNGHDVSVQWVGNSELILDIEHSVHRVAGAFINTYILKPKKR